MIRWFAEHDVAANLLLLLIVFAGVHAMMTRVPLEVFPVFERQRVSVKIPWRGATPVDIETAVILPAEAAVAPLADIREIHSKAEEGLATLTLELHERAHVQRAIEEIKSRLDTIKQWPDGAEKPQVTPGIYRRQLISVMLSGDTLDERDLRQLGLLVRDELVRLPGVSEVELAGSRARELVIEVSPSQLQRYGLTLEEVQQAVRRVAVNQPVGVIQSASERLRLRVPNALQSLRDFSQIPLKNSADGGRLLLSDVATLRDGFSEEPLQAHFNGKPCVVVNVFQNGEENAISVVKQVRAALVTLRQRFPDSVTLDTWRDRSRIIKDRLNTLGKSAWQGGLLVMLLLALFLHPWVALWICVGIPVAFMGAVALMPVLGVTLNLFSVFAFILVLGIVVDDAIVTGENIYSRLKKSANGLTAAVRGTQEVALPVTFGILTTMMAFLPLMMIEGRRGQLYGQMSLVVIPLLLFSLIESKWILPAHLKHLKPRGGSGVLWRGQQFFSHGLERFIRRFYQPFLRVALRWRYTTLALFVGVAILISALVASGSLRFVFFPRVQSETAKASVIMPIGTPFSVTAKHVERLVETAKQLQARHVDPLSGQSVIRHILSIRGATGASRRGQSHLGRVTLELVSPDVRTLDITTAQLVREWRELIGPLPGAAKLSFRSAIGHSRDPIDVHLSGQDFARLAAASERIKSHLKSNSGVFDVSDSFEQGHSELSLSLKPTANVNALSQEALNRQVRQAFLGETVLYQQQGLDEVRVVVRYPQALRHRLHTLETLPLRTRQGKVVPFHAVAEAKWLSGMNSIKRINRQRVINVTADVDQKNGDLQAIQASLRALIEQLRVQYADVEFALEGEAKEQAESLSSLTWGVLFVLLAIYALLAVPFQSYSQPLMVMMVVPFGLVGAVLGHVIMGINLSLFSLLGMLALIGVVVNDSLVLVDYVNKQCRRGLSPLTAVRRGGVARFRAILLTSLTTFAGLMPLMLEKSTQAQFLIPMAVSLAFGVLFATLVTLVLIPVAYLIMHDIKHAFIR